MIMVRYSANTNVQKVNLKKNKKDFFDTRRPIKKEGKLTKHETKVSHKNGKMAILANKRKNKEEKKSEFLPR